jgi:hypothetical protein
MDTAEPVGVAAGPAGAIDVSARALLAVWSSITGKQLSADLETKFLAHPMVPHLTKHPLAALSAAGAIVSSRGPLKLAEWLKQIEGVSDPAVALAGSEDRTATPATSGTPKTPRSNRPSPTRRTNTPIRSRDGLTPQRPVDWELAKRIGPVQRYDDTF